MSIGRTLRTVRHLKPVQVGNRLWRTFRRPSPRLGPPPPRRAIGALAQQCPRPQSLIEDDLVRLLGIDRRLEGAGDWNRTDWPKLWLYALHYHDGLRSADSAADIKHRFVTRWMGENPPLSGNGWEPYPLSLRIVNWVFWLSGGARPDPAILDSLAVQVRALEDQLEYHLLGNHLWANAKALIIAGLFFEGAEAERWYSRGLAIAAAQRDEQFLADGGHFELSPVYHQLMTEDLLDLIAFSWAAGRPLAQAWTATAQRALEWLSAMTRPDGSVPLFNDSFEAAAPPSCALFAYGERLGLSRPSAPRLGLQRLEQSGYARWRSEGFDAWVDVGRIGPDYIPGHGHADCLGFELFASGRPLIVDTGVSTYERSDRRLYERGTMAHNCVTVGDCDQAELWASFRVGRRPNVLGLTADATSLGAEHDGYDRLGARHRRTFAFGARSLLICDTVRRSRLGPAATARFHFASTEQVSIGEQGAMAGPLRIRWSAEGKARLEPCRIASGFGTTSDSHCLAIDFETSLETRIDLS